ncbi:hypothetical protein KRM28CT15_24860 [Krasilnikovia sp. M28-CT-15]
MAVTHAGEASVPRIVGVRELAHSADSIIREITQSGESVFLTHHGRFVAMITPLEAGAVESTALAFAAAEEGYLEEPRDGEPQAPAGAAPASARNLSVADARRQLQR